MPIKLKAMSRTFDFLLDLCESFIKLLVDLKKRRKYFSTLERLRIANGASSSPTGRKMTMNANRPSTSSGYGSGHLRIRSQTEQQVTPRPRTRSGRRPSQPEDYVLSRREAEWFMALPDKIKKQQFSREEQALLTRQCEAVILDPADEALLRSSYKATSVEPAERTSMSSALSHVTPLRTVRSSSEPTIDIPVPDADMPVPFPQLCRSFSGRVIDSRPSSHSSAKPPASFQSPLRTQIKTGRYVPIPIPSQIRQPPVNKETGAVYYRDAEVRKKLRLYLGSAQKFDEAIEFGFPSVKKLAKHNTTPSKAPVQHHALDNRVLNSDVQKFLTSNDDSLSFLDLSDEPSHVSELEGDNVDIGSEHAIDELKEPLVPDNSSLSDLEDPKTPSTVCEDQFEMVGPTPGHYLTSRKPSLASLKVSPDPGTATPLALPSRNSSAFDSANTKYKSEKPLPPDPFDNAPRSRKSHLFDSYERGLFSNREMTLRLTLTRPELRASEEEIYGWQNDMGTSKLSKHLHSDPLALEELPPLVEDDSGAMGAFSTQKKGAVLKVWKLMGRR